MSSLTVSTWVGVWEFGGYKYHHASSFGRCFFDAYIGFDNGCADDD